MRVALVSPDRKHVVEGRARGEARLKAPFPPLSLLQVAALTPPEHQVVLLDEALEDLDFDVPCDLVGITAFTSAAPRAYEVAAEFRHRGIPVVVGGMHASACPEEAQEHCDAVVIGEAEGVWERVLEDAEARRLQKVYCSAQYPDMSTAPAPRRDLLRRGKYLVPDTVQATRGCTHDCSFCSVAAFFGRRIRSRPVEKVAAEVRSLPGSIIAFVDDDIASRPKYASDLFERLVGTGKKWLGQASSAALENTDLIRLAGRSGCKGLFVGLETLSDVALRQVNKGFNVVARFKDTIKRLHDAGIGVIGSFMFGFDNEGDAVFERTAEFAEEARIDVPQYSILTPLPGTRLHAQMEAEGRIIDRDWSHYDGGHVVFAPRGTTPEKLQDGLKAALKHSYSCLGILRRLIGVSARLPTMLALNLAFRRRAIPWATGTSR